MEILFFSMPLTCPAPLVAVATLSEIRGGKEGTVERGNDTSHWTGYSSYVLCYRIYKAKTDFWQAGCFLGTKVAQDAKRHPDYRETQRFQTLFRYVFVFHADQRHTLPDHSEATARRIYLHSTTASAHVHRFTYIHRLENWSGAYHAALRLFVTNTTPQQLRQESLGMPSLTHSLSQTNTLVC